MEEKYNDSSSILKQVERMQAEGADIIDIGAFSSRPGAQMISVAEEKERLKRPLQSILKEFPDLIISVDTYRKETAELSLDLGASIINDITAGSLDPELLPYIAKQNVPYIAMHMQNKPENMQDDPTYQDVSKELFQWFAKRIEEFKSLGLKDIIIDPGFGFGKTIEHNYQLLKDLPHFKRLGHPILVGISRKGMIQKVSKTNSEEALNATTSAHTIALLNDANILRVHDVKEAKEAISIVDYYQKLNIVPDDRTTS